MSWMSLTVHSGPVSARSVEWDTHATFVAGESIVGAAATLMNFSKHTTKRFLTSWSRAYPRRVHRAQSRSLPSTSGAPRRTVLDSGRASALRWQQLNDVTNSTPIHISIGRLLGRYFPMFAPPSRSCIGRNRLSDTAAHAIHADAHFGASELAFAENLNATNWWSIKVHSKSARLLLISKLISVNQWFV